MSLTVGSGSYLSVRKRDAQKLLGMVAGVGASLLLVLALAGPANAQTEDPPYEQLGADIDADAADDSFGAAVAVSDDGDTVIIGSPNSNDFLGGAQVYRWDGSAWTQLGADLVPAPFISDGFDNFGSTTAISADGNTVAVGGPFGGSFLNGSVRVFDWDGSAWNQRGPDLEGDSDLDTFGQAVALSDDGRTLVVGYPEDDFGTYGRTDFFFWDGTRWSLEATFAGTEPDESFGTVVAVSGDGDRAIVGTDSGAFGDFGRARVFERSGSTWTQIGGDLIGDLFTDGFGTSVAISDDGNEIAIGAHEFVRALSWNGTAWILLGADIAAGPSGLFGQTPLAMSNDGFTIAVGSGSGNVAQLFELDGLGWVQTGGDFVGEASVDQFGTSVSLSGDGATLVVGAPGSPFSTPDPAFGYVRAFRESLIMIGDMIVTVNLAAGEMPTDGDDVVLGTPEDDMIDAGGGDDVIFSGGGNDVVVGGSGDDVIDGGDGDDVISGNDGDDVLEGGNGEDVIFGGSGNDDVSGGDADDLLGGGSGEDTVSGGDGDDRISGGSDDDIGVYGDAGNDAVNGGGEDDAVVEGGDGDDTVSGNGGNDVVNGGDGNDQVRGGQGNDTVNGDAGDDFVAGNSGADTCDGGTGGETTGDTAAGNCEAIVNVE